MSTKFKTGNAMFIMAMKKNAPRPPPARWREADAGGVDIRSFQAEDMLSNGCAGQDEAHNAYHEHETYMLTLGSILKKMRG